MSVVERLADLQYRALDRARHAGAFEVAREAGTATSFASLRGARQCLLVTFKRSGEAEAAVARNWSAAMRPLERGLDLLPIETVYVEVVPVDGRSGASAAGSSGATAE